MQLSYKLMMMLLKVLVLLVYSKYALSDGWVSWYTWGSCSVTCGSGTRYRYRMHYYIDSCDSYGYQTVRYETESCNTQTCPVNGGWGNWSGWNGCTVTCGGGTRTRTRTCNNPSPSYGGSTCYGSSLESDTCNVQYCPVNGGWGDWSGWNSCPVSCGEGNHNRTRTCNNPSPSYGGSTCYGSSVESQACNVQYCPVNGGWGDWSGWISCPVSCGGGNQNRNRTCNNPSPSYGGSTCYGQPLESQPCNVYHCPVDGNWSPWTSTGICSSTCGGGVTPFVRQCNNPQSDYGGQFCVGNNVINRSCNVHHCPVDGHWSDWGNWTVCNTTCGDGYQNRSRECDNPRPMYGGSFCPDSGYEIRECNFGPCVALTLDGSGISKSIVATIAVSSAFFIAFTLIIFYFIRHRMKKSSEAKVDDQPAFDEVEETGKTKAFDNKEYCSFREDTSEISLPPRRMRNKDQLSTKTRIMKRISTIYENLKIN